MAQFTNKKYYEYNSNDGSDSSGHKNNSDQPHDNSSCRSEILDRLTTMTTQLKCDRNILDSIRHHQTSHIANGKTKEAKSAKKPSLYERLSLNPVNMICELIFCLGIMSAIVITGIFAPHSVIILLLNHHALEIAFLLIVIACL